MLNRKFVGMHVPNLTIEQIKEKMDEESAVEYLVGTGQISETTGKKILAESKTEQKRDKNK